MRARRSGLGMFALALQASLLAACGRQGAPAPSAWVGSAACASCHADVASAWRSSTHHLAMLRAGPGEDLRAPLTADGPLVRRGDGLALTAASLGHDSDVRIDYALGHQHVEQYLGTLHEGRLQALPRAWDVRAGEWFDLFAGEERRPEDWGHWTNRGMNANAQCLFCHTTDYDKGYLPATDGYASRWSEMGVGCEACHGPGAEHVRARRDGGGVDPYRGVDPERLLGACGSCHSRRVERARFTPGDDFFSAFEPEVFDGEPYYPDGQVKEELYELVSFATSRMYRKGVRCWNCHDPHANETKAPGNQLCRTCHDARYDDPGHTHHAVGGAGGDCRGCHMPVTVYMQRDPRHDHSFSRPDPEATELLGVPNACNRCHRDRDAAWAAVRMREWYPDDRERARRRDVAQTIARGRAGDASAVPGLVALLRAGTDAVRRASAARLLARFPTASGVTDALDDALGTDDPMVRSGAAWALGERTVLAPEARDALLRVAGDPNRVVRQHVGYALRAVQPASLGADAARALDRAVAEWRDGQAWLGDTPEAHYNLAVFAATRGDGDTAVAEYREALRLWPESYQARHNLGMLLAQTGRLDEAAAEFEAVLARDPVPDTAFALGLLRAQQGRWPEAIAALERCVAADPSFPRGRYNLALAYAKSGDVEKAMDELEQAAALDDTHREAVLTLVDLARQVHDKARLERWVLEAARLDPSTAETPEVRELLERR